MKFSSKRPHYEYLRKKWMLKQSKIKDNFWEKHGDAFKHITAGSLGLMLMSVPQHQLPVPVSAASREAIIDSFDQNVLLAQTLSEVIPNEVRPLDPFEEKIVTSILSNNFGFKVTSDLEGIRLNRNFGLIGGEQHLYRYPGDNLYAHAQSSLDWAKYSDAGIAPGLGAWGYFVPAKEDFTETDREKERYYLAIQTFLAPGFAENFSRYREFFRFRKMLVVNPRTGQSVVAVIADAGPAEWTGKHLGGSPEVMDALGLAQGPRKGPVLYFFIDDSKNEVPLGPVKVRSQI